MFLTRASLALASIVASTVAVGQIPDRVYQLRYDQLVSGSVFRDTVAKGSPYPLNRRFESFTNEEKAVLRGLYEEMPDTDEPPFPKDGMRELIRDVASIAGGLAINGKVIIAVNVDPRGNATSVRLLQYPNLEAAKAIAYVLVKKKYKPGICSGNPCSLEFPFDFEFITK